MDAVAAIAQLQLTPLGESSCCVTSTCLACLPPASQVLIKPEDMRLHEALADHLKQLKPDLCVFGSHRLGQVGEWQAGAGHACWARVQM